MITSIFWIIPLASVLALAFAWFFFRQMMKESEGTELMKKIASFVREGAMSYLKQQYKVVASVFVVLVILFSIMAYGFHVQNEWVPIAFLTGGFFSGLAGFLGMKDVYKRQELIDSPLHTRRIASANMSATDNTFTFSHFLA